MVASSSDVRMVGCEKRKREMGRIAATFAWWVAIRGRGKSRKGSGGVQMVGCEKRKREIRRIVVGLRSVRRGGGKLGGNVVWEREKWEGNVGGKK